MADRAYTRKLSPATIAWNTICANGTARDIETGAYYSAYGRTDSIVKLAASITARTRPSLSLVA